MATEVTGRLLRNPYVVQVGARATLVRTDLFFRIRENGDPKKAVPITIDYRPEWFNGMTKAQALQAMKVDGIGGIPSWRTIRDNLRDDWDRAGVLRSIPETEF